MKRTAARSKSSAARKPVSPTGNLAKVLALIKAHPGIRPSQINQRLKLAQSDSLRGALIKRGLIRKKKEGSAMRYYSV